MKKLQMWKKAAGKWQLFAGVFAIAFALVLFCDGFSMVSHADSQGKITANSAKVRKEATTQSEHVGSVLKDEVVTIVGQTQGEGGHVWYQVVVNENLSGYIRSDLVQVAEEAAEVTKVNPISGTVKGSTTVRVRSNASTSSEIVTTVSSGTTLTVTGKATASDGKVWYQVNFNVDGSQVEGFIRYDYVELSGELTPYTQQPVTPTQEPSQPPVEDPGTTEPQDPEPTPDVVKEYDTMEQDGTWFLVKTETNEGWDIQGLFDGVEKNAEAFKESEKTVKSQKVVIIILVFLLVAAAAGVGFLVFKIKDMMDSAYFNQVEAETIRRKNSTSSQSNKRVMHTVGEDKKPARPAGAAQGQRPAGAATQGQRPAGAAQGLKTAGAAQGLKTAGSPQGQRPAGAAPQGQRPAGAAPQGQRPAGAAPQGLKTAGAPQGQKSAGAPQAPKTGAQAQGWQSKNFMADDDEFEFEFLNYDGDDEK